MMLRALALACTLFAALPAAAQPQQGPPAVGFVVAERRPVTELTEFIGRVEAINRVDIRARVTGFLERRLFTEGSEVPEDAPLFVLEKPPFEAALAQARAQVASAEAQLANARVALTRARELRATGAGTQVALDNAEAQARTAQAQLLGAQAQVRTAEISLAYTEITAPIAGAIGRANFTPGNVVAPNLEQPLATIVSQDPMRIAFTVPQRQAIELRQRFESRGGAAATVVRVRTVDGSLYPHPGAIDFIDTQLDRTTDTLLVRASIPNPVRPGATTGQPGSRGLIDGQFVTVLLEGAEPVQAIIVPRAAVAQDQTGAYVFVVGDNNQAQRRNIRLGRSTADTAVVEGGLEGGERVITEGVQRVRPGAPVNAVPAGTPPQRPAGGPGAPAGGGR
jgi:membrane fusion protein (multidrug efflux system)